MANDIEVKIPDIGGSTQVDVIEILVKVGDKISIDTPLITLESDKASMEIPSPIEGTVTKLNVKVGDKVSEGDVILFVVADKVADTPKEEPKPTVIPQENQPEASSVQETTTSVDTKEIEVKVPDIGGATQVDVIEIMVKEGDSISVDTPLITLESDKASMEIPSPVTGTVTKMSLKIGDKVAEGDVILVAVSKTTAPKAAPRPTAVPATAASVSEAATVQAQASPANDYIPPSTVIAAGPAVRRMARELGVNLADVQGSGRKSRIMKEDLQAYVKARLSAVSTAPGTLAMPAAPSIDFSLFGEIEIKPLNKIKKLTGQNVHRSWITIPHVTQFDSADITDIEAFRKTETDHAKDKGYKLTLLAFVCAVVSKALRVYPQFNASLDASGANLTYKKYCNIGIAVETPNGLVVPVIKNVDKLTVTEIAMEMRRLSVKARDKGLMPGDMSGGCFTISSLGGIGGTSFTPIVNSPEVAILGLSRSEIKPVYQDGVFQPRLILPLSLSYDHRVIDGAEAARFTRYIAECLADIRRILL
ncbi:MAG: dihydrolipoyllysine-residue acetyltransferase [Legionella sp.]|uniref:dihydrolipoyllysine-residue acetyltransferase n=1 Tax=Legionella sp. TaxID=459 RepID=UPI0039E563D9